MLIQPVGLSLEGRIARAVADQTGSLAAGWHGCGRPDQAGLLIAQVERFARQIGQWVVAPGSQPVLAAVFSPGATRSGFRDQKTKLRIGNHVDPRVRRVLPRLEINDVFFPVGAETAQAVVHQQAGGSMPALASLRDRVPETRRA